MDQGHLAELKRWFDGYVSGFYGRDEIVDANIRIKEQHSRRTCKEMLYLASKLGLLEDETRTAETVALLHDVGRFEQFIRYRTYSDPRSINHGLLGLEVLRANDVLGGLLVSERGIIETAVAHHGAKQLPEGLAGLALLFSRMIRDADKLDVLFIVTKLYTEYRDDPDGFLYDLELPDEPACSARVIEAILCEQRIGYDMIRTLNDMKLLQLAWVFDVNFAATFKRIKKRRLLAKLIGLLPCTEEIKKVADKVFAYVDNRIRRGDDSC